MTRAASSRKSPTQVFILNGISLLGIGASIALTQHFYEVRNGTAGFKSFCNIGHAMNCDAIAASSYAELIPGVPLSSLGAGAFLAIFLVSLFAHNPFWRRETVRALFGLTLFGSLVSLFYLGIMAFRLKTYCLLCLGVDVLQLVSFFLVLSLKPEGFSIHPPERAKWKVLLPVVLLSVAISTLALKGMDQMSLQASDLRDLADSVLRTTPVSVNSGAEFPSFGPENAPITIVEFSDFQCPFCRLGAYSIHSVMNHFPGQIRVVFRHFPLDQACNPNMSRTAHPVACEAARVAYCSHRVNRFEPVYEGLFEKQATFHTGKAIEIAKELGLNENLLQTCVASPEAGLAISRDINEAKTLGVQSTPTFFINGYRMDGAYPVPAWIKIIDSLLKK